MKRYPLFDALRLVLALSVLVHHCLIISESHNGQPLYWSSPHPAVPAFMAIAGFFVLQSYERSGSWTRFAWRRLLRIGPAFVMMLLAGGTLYSWSYLPNTLASWATFGMENPWPGNAVVWSLSCEEVAYLLLAVLFALGFYRLRWPVIVAVAFSLALPAITPSEIHVARIAQLPIAFFMGNLAYAYRDKMQGFWNWAERAMPWWRVPDISYGLYIYHALAIRYARGFGIEGNAWLFLVSSATLTMPLCLASWYLIEKPALRLKDAKLQLAWKPPARTHSSELRPECATQPSAL